MYSKAILLFLLTIGLNTLKEQLSYIRFIFFIFRLKMQWPLVWIAVCSLCMTGASGGKILVYPVDGSH